MSGSSRRAEGFLAQVLQRRQNRDTFQLHRIDADARPDLARRGGATGRPALVVIEGEHEQARLEQPKGRAAIRAALARWLR